MEIKLTSQEYENLLNVYFTASMLVDPERQDVIEPVIKRLAEYVAKVKLKGIE